MNYQYTPELILIHPEVEHLPVTQEVLASYPGIGRRLASSAGNLIEELRRGRHPETQGKRTLYLTRHQGQFLKSCPGICDNVTCCDYHIMDLGSNCPLECTYCVLQSYLNNPLMVLYANVEDLLQELSASLDAAPHKTLRIGTGELTDSLALDDVAGFSRRLVPFFAHRPNAFLELKTKTNKIANLEHLQPDGHTVIAWSLNTPHIIATEEFKTCTLDERLTAALRCASWGYQLAFHFDPLIHYPDWEAHYRQTVERLFEVVPAEQIAWISLGALRLPAGLRAAMQRRFPRSRLPLGEFVTGVDGKGRYYRPLRTEMYRKMSSWIRQHNPAQTLYLCMESPHVWQEAVGSAPSADTVAAMLDHSLVSIAP